MKRSFLIFFVSAAALTASTYASTVDFSAYSSGATLGTSVTNGDGHSSAVLLDSSSNPTEFTYYQGFQPGTQSGLPCTATYSGVVQGSGGSSNYLQMQAVRTYGYGRPWGQVSTTTAFDTTVAGQQMSWSSTFVIDVKGDNGSIKTGLFAYNALSLSGTSTGSYGLSQTQQANGDSIGLEAVFQAGSNNLQIMRTGNAGTAEFWNSSTSSWQSGSTSISQWAVDTTYTVNLTADSTTGILTLSIINEGTSATVISVTTDLDEQAASASAGGLRFSTGNLENNSADGWTVNLNEVSASAIPEPAEYALMLGVIVVLGAWLRRRR
jgi:hypothetical protein